MTNTLRPVDASGVVGSDLSDGDGGGVKGVESKKSEKSKESIKTQGPRTVS